MDRGGSEFYQLYTLKDGRLTLLTDGKSRNDFGAWSKDGRLVGYSSTRRNGTDSDLYVVDPRDPKSNRMVAQVKGGGWGIAAFMPDGREAIVADFAVDFQGQSLSPRLAQRGDAADRRSPPRDRLLPDQDRPRRASMGAERRR